MDEEAAQVVQRIYALCLEGYGPTQIARMLKEDNVPVPTGYWLSNGQKPNTTLPDNPCKWVSDTAAYILERKEYWGHRINFKTYKQSYKSKKKLWNPEEKQMVFENTHEAIISVDAWEKVQALRKNKRGPTRTGKTNLFSGVAYCADCGAKLYYCTSKSFKTRQDHFADYEAEQVDLESKLGQWQTELDEQEQHAEDVERFIRKCRRYKDLQELTPTILNDLVYKVFVEAPDKSERKRRQNIHISYDLLGILPELNTPAHEEMA